MAENRPPKRPRISTGGAFHDVVPFLDDIDYDLVHASEGTLRRVGNDFLSARVERDTKRAADSWQKTTSWSPPDDPQFALDPNGDLYDAVLEGQVMDENPPPEPLAANQKKKKLRRMFHRNVPTSYGWISIVKPTLRRSHVGRAEGTFGTPETVRTASLVALRPPEVLSIGVRNASSPISIQTGSEFIKISLKTLGLKIQLNHSSMFCESPIPCHASILVLHTNGIHSVAIQYCGCSRAIPHHLQLLRRRLYPASQISVKTCATFELLRHLHKMALTTKASTYDFYRCLEKSTNNTGIDLPKSRYRALFRMIMQWRHLQMLKWAAIQHQPSGIAGINLLDGWENAPDEMKFLYMMIICMDANFRLKNQLVSNYSQDPGLGIGWAYMVPRKPYEEYVLSRANDTDISTCVGFQALAKANNKFSVGLRYTGTNLTACGRSEMILPLGVGNLQKGERYPNMDYIFGSTLQFILVHLILISYDIMCQWFINLFKRIDEHWPDHIKPRPDMTFIPAIPKLHEPMHNAVGHEVYSLNFIKGCGHSDCECPERIWAPHNALANSTKTQGPGSRQDVFDDHFGFWNWQKYTSMGSTLLRRYKAAVKDRNLQVEGHRGLTASLDPKLVGGWEKMCVDWDEDTFPKKKKNPYHLEGAGMSEAKVKKDLAEEEAKYLANGGNFLHATTASMFIYMGLDLEEMQRRYHTNHPPTSQPTSNNPEDAPLWLPSRLPSAHRSRLCVRGLAAIEERVRNAQLPDSLENIKKILKIKSRLIQFKNKNVRGQRDGTRSRAVIDECMTEPGIPPRSTEKPESPNRDIRGYQDPNRLRQRVGRRGVLEDDQLDGEQGVEQKETDEFTLFNETRSRRDGTGETRRTLSWIWLTIPSSDSDDNNTTFFEEMRRVLAFLEWKAKWWRSRELAREGVSKDLAEGLAAYARSQARLQDSLAAHFRELWKAPLQDNTLADNVNSQDADVNADDDDEDESDEEDGDSNNLYDDEDMIDGVAGV
ncbi:hypothetical protein BDZ97DRAFT_1927721 [Flammula alnicola]|nr:hypothetical protein BDZ97DRAFT_1927721 [Flammula alnicola]